VGLFKARTKEPKDTSDQVVGGFAFFLSLLLLLPTGMTLFVVAIAQIRHADLSAVLLFATALIAGIGLAHYLVKGHLSVLIHEWKHEVVSSLVGNRNKRMEVQEHSGSLQYEYTEQTAHYNAFIALAPYILPLSTFIGILTTLAISPSDPRVPLIIIGVSYGIDLLMNARDISPIQSDIHLIRGGFYVGLLYIISWNMITTALTFAWAFNGFSGITELVHVLAKLFIALYSAVTGWQPGQ
jgi:hypothetical protein